MINFLKKIIKINNVETFFKNIYLLKNKIYENIFNTKYKDITLTSGEAMIIFSLIPFFFKNYILKNLNEYYVRCYLIHRKYLDIIMDDSIKKEDLSTIEYLTKELIKIYVQHKVKVIYFFYLIF